MPMKPNCIAAVRAAAKEIGREGITDSEILAIDERMQKTMRRLAYSEEGWQGMSLDMRISLAAERAIEDIRAAAQRKKTNADIQVVKTKATEDRILTQLRLFDKANRTEGLARDMINVENDIAGLRQESFSRLIDLMDAVKSYDGTSATRRVGMFLFDAENPTMTRDIAREIYAGADGHTGNKVAQEGAKAWLKVIDDLRQRFNNGGGDIGKLDYGFVPIAHNAMRVRGLNGAEARDTWVGKVIKLLDRRRYVDEAGARLSDADLTNVLGEMWKTIKSDGLNKQEPGAFKGDGARANRGSDHREIHFKDGDAYLEYMSEYGQGSMYSLMQGHIGKMARDIGLVEAYGPNPNAQMRLQFDHAAGAEADGKMTRLGFGVGIFRVNPEGMWRTMNGEASTPGSQLGSAVGSHVRNVQALKLAGTFLKMFPDLASYFITTGYNRLGYWNAIANLGRSATKEGRDWAAMHGLMADSASRAIQRYIGDNINENWSGRLSNAQMKLTLGEAWTNWLTRAYEMTQMGAMGRLAGQDWVGMKQWDRILLERHGVTEADWSVIRATTPEMLNGMPMLTPDAILLSGHAEAARVADRVLGVIRDESSIAVLKADLMTRTAMTWNGMQSGTGLGEFARSTMQFKSFPLAMVTRHWRRMMDMPNVTDGSAPMLANRAIYIGALSVSATALGAISLQATQIASGKDPIDMTGDHALKFWVQAFSVGGAGGFYSDILTRDSSSDRSAMDAVGSLFGPTISDVAQAWHIGKGNIDNKLAGKTTHTAAESVRFLRSHVPFVNIWYAKAAIDHIGMHALQENLSPGYLGKMQQRDQKEWGQSRWWRPGTGVPDRAPDIPRAVGQ